MKWGGMSRYHWYVYWHQWEQRYYEVWEDDTWPHLAYRWQHNSWNSCHECAPSTLWMRCHRNHRWAATGIHEARRSERATYPWGASCGYCLEWHDQPCMSIKPYWKAWDNRVESSRMYHKGIARSLWFGHDGRAPEPCWTWRSTG